MEGFRNIFLTGDQHFGHANIIGFCQRPFKHVDEMDEAMIAAWNSVVGSDDTVYHIGDFCLGNALMAGSYFSRLNGNIHVVPGTHDSRWWGTGLRSASGYNVVLLDQIYVFKVIFQHVVLCHYSMRTWPFSHNGSIHFYGHSHGRIRGHGLSADVGVDAVGFAPIQLEEAIKKVNQDYRAYKEQNHVQRSLITAAA